MSSGDETSSDSSATESSSDGEDTGDTSRLDDQLKLLRPTCPQVLLDYTAHIQEHAHTLLAQLEAVTPVRRQDMAAEVEQAANDTDIPEKPESAATASSETSLHEEAEDKVLEEKIASFGKGLLDVMETKFNALSRRLDDMTLRGREEKGEEVEAEVDGQGDKGSEADALRDLLEQQNAKMKQLAERIASQEAKLEEQKRAFLTAAEQQAKDWEMDSLETFTVSPQVKSGIESSSSAEEFEDMAKRVQALRRLQLDSTELERPNTAKNAREERIAHLAEDKENRVMSPEHLQT